MSGKPGRSGRRSANEERKFKDLSNITFDYLVNNFHKFTEQNKIKIALEIQKRVIPTKVEATGKVFTFADLVMQVTKQKELDEIEDAKFREPERLGHNK